MPLIKKSHTVTLIACVRNSYVLVPAVNNDVFIKSFIKEKMVLYDVMYCAGIGTANMCFVEFAVFYDYHL